jgi:hypothetical protein
MKIVSSREAGTKRFIVCVGRKASFRLSWKQDEAIAAQQQSRRACSHLYSDLFFILFYLYLLFFSAAFPAIYSDEKGPDGNRFQHAACCRCHDPEKQKLWRRWQVERLDLTDSISRLAAAPAVSAASL